MGAPTPICLRRCHYHLHNDLTVAPQGLLYDIPAFLVKGSFRILPECLRCIRKLNLLTLCRLMSCTAFLFFAHPPEGNSLRRGIG